jgi:hypothetical protein
LEIAAIKFESECSQMMTAGTSQEMTIEPESGSLAFDFPPSPGELVDRTVEAISEEGRDRAFNFGRNFRELVDRSSGLRLWPRPNNVTDEQRQISCCKSSVDSSYWKAAFSFSRGTPGPVGFMPNFGGQSRLCDGPHESCTARK